MEVHGQWAPCRNSNLTYKYFTVIFQLIFIAMENAIFICTGFMWVINCTFLFVILSKQMFNPLKQIYFRLLLLAFLPFTISIYPDASNEHIENMLISKDKRKFSKLSKVKIWRYIDIYLLLLPFENPLVSKIKKNLCL